MTDLITRLTEATGPSRELDAEIDNWRMDADLAGAGKTKFSPFGPRPYTASIDSALTLLRGIWCIYAMEFPSVKYLPANADGGFTGATEICVPVTSNIPTALCIAALRARGVKP